MRIMVEPLRKKMTLPDGDVSFLEWAGDGPLVHFSHANGFNAETYRGLLTPLAGRFHVIACDARGHGFSTLRAVPESQKDWGTFGEDLARIVDRLDKLPVILAGHSMGGTASLMVAAKYPERVRALVLVEPVLVPRFSRLKMRLMRLVGRTLPPGTNLAELAAKRRAIFPSFELALSTYRGRGAFKSWTDETIADYLHGGLASTGNGTEVQLTCAPAWESMNFRNAPAGLARLAGQVRCPLTLIYAGDGTARENEVRIVARKHGNARLVKVPGTTHFLPMERPDIVREEIERIARPDRSAALTA